MYGGTLCKCDTFPMPECMLYICDDRPFDALALLHLHVTFHYFRSSRSYLHLLLQRRNVIAAMKTGYSSCPDDRSRGRRVSSTPSLPGEAPLSCRRAEWARLRKAGGWHWLWRARRVTVETMDEVRTFEDLSPEERARASMAACQFLLRNDYVSLQEGADRREISLHQLWREIIVEAGLPICALPAFAVTT